jgi:hypothetical protein
VKAKVGERVSIVLLIETFKVYKTLKVFPAKGRRATEHSPIIKSGSCKEPVAYATFILVAAESDLREFVVLGDLRFFVHVSSPL